MPNYKAISVEQVKEQKNNIHRDLIESVVIYDNSEFDKLGINVITDIENADTQYQFFGKNGTAQVYDPDNLKESKIGYLKSRELKVTLAVSRKKDNIQSYREKEPFTILEGGQYRLPNTEWRLHKIMELYRGDILAPMFHGKKSLGKTNPMGLYDGVYTMIEQLINEGTISEANGNLVKMEAPFIAPAQVGDMYAAFEAWVEGWDPKLHDAEEVLVYMPSTTRRQLIGDYMKTYTGFQGVDAGKDSFRFVGYENIKLVSSPFMGNANPESGAMLIATLPGNIDFGYDIEGDTASINVVVDPDDTNNIIFQIQTAQGMRIRAVSSDCLAVNDGLNDPREGLGNGQYHHDTITVTSNNTELGTVSVSPQKVSYAQGERVQLNAEAIPSNKFVKWSDGCTLAKRDIVYSGFPESYQAIFEAAE